MADDRELIEIAKRIQRLVGGGEIEVHTRRTTHCTDRTGDCARE